MMIIKYKTYLKINWYFFIIIFKKLFIKNFKPTNESENESEL